MENKIELESVKLSLKSIVTTLGLILEDMGEEHEQSKGVEVAFYTRAEDVYLPALDLIQASACCLLKEMEVGA